MAKHLQNEGGDQIASNALASILGQVRLDAYRDHSRSRSYNYSSSMSSDEEEYSRHCHGNGKCKHHKHSGETSQSQEAKEVADKAIIEAEQFKASINPPKGINT